MCWLNAPRERYFKEKTKTYSKRLIKNMKKPYRRQSLHFTRENLNLRLNISWGHVTLGSSLQSLIDAKVRGALNCSFLQSLTLTQQLYKIIPSRIDFLITHFAY